MRGKHTLVINGKVYDAITGLPVAAPDHLPRKQQPVSIAIPFNEFTSTPISTQRKTLHAKTAHSTTQKSATLRRDVLKKPVAKPQIGSARRKPAPGHVAKSDLVRRFAPHPQALQTRTTSTPAPTTSTGPHTVRGHSTQVPAPAIVTQKQALVTSKRSPEISQKEQVLSSRSLKEHLIAERLAQVDTTAPRTEKKATRKSSLSSKRPRMVSLLTASFAIMVLGGYFTYLNMPGLSVRVAAAQAGVAATFPDYHPDGYRFSGPVAFAPGQVAINFFSNGGTAKYTVTEQKSTWDSQAVYDNLVAKATDNNYVTNSQQGLTIYTFKGEAAWVNKGILYTVSGDAPLSNEQLLRIAASL